MVAWAATAGFERHPLRGGGGLSGRGANLTLFLILDGGVVGGEQLHIDVRALLLREDTSWLLEVEDGGEENWKNSPNAGRLRNWRG